MAPTTIKRVLTPAPGWFKRIYDLVTTVGASAGQSEHVAFCRITILSSTSTHMVLLKRDLDPASNDNDPMWLEKVA
jgi:hypothetical protein